MSLLLNLLFRALHLLLLRSASLLVPPGQRAEWLLEWNTELHYACNSILSGEEFSWPAQQEVIAFCLGAFQDAACLRRQSFQPGTNAPHVHSSAMQCLLWLSTALACCAILAQLLPGVHAEFDTIRYPLRSNLILIHGTNVNNTAEPAVTFAQYQDWRVNRQRFFNGLAFYRSRQEAVSAAKMQSATLTVAFASPNAIPLLGLPILSSSDMLEEDQAIPQAVLSYETWVRSFHSDPAIAGRIIQVGRQAARIAGVLPCGSWRLPSTPDLWLLAPESQIASAIGNSPGYVLAHLTPLGQAYMSAYTVPITIRGANDSEPQIFGVLCADHSEGPWRIYFFALFLAVLALPAVTSVSMSESNFSTHHPSHKQNFNRWLFLVVKLALVAAIAYFASLDIAYWNADAYSETAELLQLLANFLLCLFGLRWALMDQRNRCPVCLRRVTHPARVGLVSQTFLGWNGTEMICTGGHTLLHVPSLPTSWFGAQRWMYLDTSWEFLFADLPY